MTPAAISTSSNVAAPAAPATPSNASHQSKAHILTLPPEIRNRIYDLAFANPTTSVNLLEAAPPSKNLVVACRQIHAESKHMYRAAYRAYWSDTHFTLIGNKNNLPAFRSEVKHLHYRVHKLDDDDVAHISRMTIDTDATWELEEGVWTTPIQPRQTIQYAFYMPFSAANRLQRLRYDDGVPLLRRSSAWGTVFVAHENEDIDLDDLKLQQQWKGLSKDEISMMLTIPAE